MTQNSSPSNGIIKQICVKHNFIGESLSVAMLSGIPVPISRMPPLEKSLITQILLLVMVCDKPVGLLQKSTS